MSQGVPRSAAISPDGRYVWFSGHQDTFNPDWSYNATLPEYQLARFDRETGQILGMSGKYGSAFRPAISPDGQWLVYGTRHEAETGLRKRDLITGREEWRHVPGEWQTVEASVVVTEPS